MIWKLRLWGSKAVTLDIGSPKGKSKRCHLEGVNHGSKFLKLSIPRFPRVETSRCYGACLPVSGGPKECSGQAWCHLLAQNLVNQPCEFQPPPSPTSFSTQSPRVHLVWVVGLGVGVLRGSHKRFRKAWGDLFVCFLFFLLRKPPRKP